MKPKKEDEFEHKIANRKSAKDLLRKHYDDPVVAGYLELISSSPLAAQIDELSDYDDSDDDDIRPY